MGLWDDIAPSTSLVAYDRQGEKFSAILRGRADVIYRGVKISELSDGRFMGAIDLSVRVSDDIDVVVQTAARVMCWPRKPLSAYLATRPDVALALDRSLGFEVQRVLRTTLAKVDAASS